MRQAFAGWGRHTPLLVLLLALLLSATLSLVTAELVRQQQQTRFDREVEGHVRTLSEQVAAYRNLLSATRADWLYHSGLPSLQSFSAFVNELDVEERYPGVQGLGFVMWVPDGLSAAALQELRRKVTPDYAVWRGPSPQAAATPIALLAPQNGENRAALGFDMYSEPLRRQAFDRARQVNDVQATPGLDLVQRNGAGEPLRGFVLTLPVWSGPGSKEPLQGFLYLVVRADQFLEALDRPSSAEGLSIRTELGGRPLGQVSRVDQVAYRQTRRLSLAGQPWQVTYEAGPSFGKDLAAGLPLLTLLFGMLVSVAAYRLSATQLRSRLRAEQDSATLATARAEQAQARAEFEAIFQSMQDAAAFTDADGRVRLVNRALLGLFGASEADVTGQPIEALHLDRRLAQRSTFTALTTPYRRLDGSVFSGEAQRSEVRGPGGQLLGLLEVVRDVTERVKAERALQDVQRRSREALDAIPHIVWMLDAQGQRTYVNEKHQQLAGQDFRESLPPEDQPFYDDMWARARAGGVAAQSEVQLTVAGAPRWHVVKVTPILDEGGQPREWVASATDIHDRLVAERLAQRSEQRYRGVLEGMPQIVWLTDTRGQPTYFNARWDEYVGPARAGYAFLNLLHPDERAEFQRRWTQALESREPFEAEHRLLGAADDYRTFVTRSVPIMDARGGVLEWVATTTDVDDSVYAETSARLLADLSERLTARDDESRRQLGPRYTAALNLLTEHFAQLATLWGASSEVPLASTQLQGVAADPQVAELVARVRGSGEPLYPTGTNVAHLERYHLTDGLLLPLHGTQGSLTGVLGLGFRRDLHDRDHELIHELGKRLAVALDNDRLRLRADAAQAELQSLNQSLEERVNRRTEELQEAARELEAFSYSVSHDLRTPLRHIVGFTDLLRKDAGGQLSAKSERYLTVITDASEKMSQLIDDLLQFSRMGRQELRSVPVDLHGVVAASWQGLEPDRAGRDITFVLGELPTVEGDPNLLGLVFTNLLSNAIKYTRKQERARVVVDAQLSGEPAHESAEHEKTVTIRVSDNGVGFDPRYTDKLFGVFQRLHRAEDFEGIGIGLANVRRIVSRHGGRVHAESRPGEGATFSVTLPLTRPAETPA
ncbi:PAS domain S-box protein [Deinococcus taklimakanensis]|uniref:histidine kinase n=1 Tax=Deinococcus taklimakanensis TaxID=536443 RepID=A0ABW5P039_9DEIO